MARFPIDKSVVEDAESYEGSDMIVDSGHKLGFSNIKENDYTLIITDGERKICFPNPAGLDWIAQCGRLVNCLYEVARVSEAKRIFDDYGVEFGVDDG